MIRILDETAVGSLLDMSAGVRLVEEAFGQHARGEVTMSPRTALKLEGEAGAFRVMTASLPAMFGVKTLTGIPGRRKAEEIYFAMLLFDAETGGLRCVLPAGQITPVRTGAAGGVGAKYLSREDASVVGVFGSGVQARAQVRALREVRPVERVKVYDIVPEAARSFADDLVADGVDAEVAGDARSAVQGSDIVVTATTSKSPVFSGEWLEPGTHVNAVGANSPAKKELDSEAFRRGKVVMDYREQVLLEAGDVLDAIAADVLDVETAYTELGELVAGAAPGRESADEITIFKSVGVAFQDIAVASWIYRQAEEKDLGVRMPMET